MQPIRKTDSQRPFENNNSIIPSNNRIPGETEGLKREIGVGGIFINVVNNTVGSGIYLLPAIIAAALGNASVMAYIVCGVSFLLVMLCFVEVSSQVTCSGGAYAYIEKALGPYAGFISNTLFWFGTGVFVTAALVNGVADILSVPFPLLTKPMYRFILFSIIIGTTAYINIIGVKQGMNLVKVITFIKFIPIALLIIGGFFGAKLSNLRWDHIPSIKSLGEVTLVLFFAFAGGETALNVSGEMKNPNRTGPLGLLYGILFTIVLFCAIQLVAQAVLGNDLAFNKEAPLAAVAGVLVGPWGHTLVIGGSVIAIIGILNSLPLVFSRVMFAGAKDGALPGFLAKVHPRFATPSNAIITFSVVGIIIATSGGFRQLAIIVSSTLLLIYAGVVLAAIKFRLTKQIDKPGTFKIPGGFTVHIAALVAIGWFMIQLKLQEFIGLGIFIGGLSVIYFIKTIQKKRIVEIAIPEVK